MKTILTKLTKRQWLLWCGLLLFVLFFILNRDLIMLLWDGDVEAIRKFLNKNMGYALFFMFLVMLIQNSFTVFPLILVITINMTLFGFINGFIWSWLTGVVASLIVYYGARYVFQEIIVEKFNKNLIQKIDANGFAYVFQARIFPFVPTSLINILAGLSTIRLLPYLLATSIGNFIYFFILALIPAGILSANWDEYIIWIIIAAAILLYYLVKVARNKRKSADEKTE
ncbi:TVP38/TMEM64 family protein [Bacillus sp. FJAT-22090]|uniref:TVP38/TMEM64 family protein n=1 Tax=Bacillus sp. FJAT-22090 TaxID=1581038 RepID=UPI0011A6FBFE|nr:VTT domain-containing protein [Bacillus sp. FJAT-22090]